MVAAYPGLGAELRIGDGGAPEAFAPVAGVMSITGPGKTRDTIDVTSHSSTGGWREFITGLRDGGEVSFDLNWLFGDDTAQLAFETAFDDNAPTNFQLFNPAPAANNRLAFTGYITDMSWAIPTDAQITRSVTIKVTGPITVATE